MQKLLPIVLVLFAAFAVGLMVGCEDDEPSSPTTTGQQGVADIELRLSHAEISGFVGETRTETITAIARNASGVAVPGIKIDFAIYEPKSYRGTIVQAKGDSITNDLGEIQANYSVVLERSTEVQIIATAGNVTKSTVIEIVIVDDIIHKISIQATTVLTVPQNQTASTSVIASLIDTNGLAIPNVTIHFRTSPRSLGYVDSDTGTTDIYGRVTKTFRTIVNETGKCWIFASVGRHIDSTNIDITSVAEPRNIQITTETPEITVLPNQNAQVEFLVVVTDENGNGVPNINVAFEVESVTPGGEIFGSITTETEGGTSGGDLEGNREGEGGGTKDTGGSKTNEKGEIKAIFSTFGGYGALIIRALVLPSGTSGSEEEIDPATIPLTVKLLTVDIEELRLWVLPNRMVLHPDTLKSAMVNARVTASNQKGIIGLPVNFECIYGSLARWKFTDSTGLATAEYYILPRTDFPTPETEEILEVVTATIPNTAFTEEAEITVEKSASEFGNLELTAEPDKIYADNSLTVSHLKAVLKDADRQALANREIIFTSTLGTVNSPVLTDSSGIAYAIFQDTGVPCPLDENDEPIPALITAFYPPMPEAYDEVFITILERNPVATITLIAEKYEDQAGSIDTLWVRATCFLENGDYAPEGQLVRFEATMGNFLEDAKAIEGNMGVAETNWLPPREVGIAVLRAYVIIEREREGKPDTIIYSNPVEIELIPGPPTQIVVTAIPDHLQTNDPGTFSLITATVKDTSGNAVGRGKLVTFVTTRGALNSLSCVTDDNGQSIVQLVPGVQAGDAVITATHNTPIGPISGDATVTIASSGANRIALDADPSAVACRGTGGLTASTLSATLYDPNNNQVQATYMVVFELLDEPPEHLGGSNINNHGRIDSAATSNGIATVTFNSGTEAGAKLIRAYTWADSARYDTISVILSRVQVLSGPANMIDIDVNNEGADVDGGSWAIEVSARVVDRWMNPVEDNIPVQFTCDPVAHIGESRTGNESRNGNVEPGVAYATMVYNSICTFDTLTITATVRVEAGLVTGERDHTLPLQEGSLVLHVSPEHWMIDYFDVAYFQCVAVLTDGHEVWINNGPVLFTSSRAYFHWYNYVTNHYIPYRIHDQPPELVIKYTSWHIDWGIEFAPYREPPGHATVFLIGEEYDFFTDTQAPEINVQIGASIVGYPDVVADPVVVVVTRHR